MSGWRAWSETHWHDLRKGDQVIALEADRDVPVAMLEETFHSVEILANGRVAVNFKSKYSSGTRYDDAINGKVRFFVRGKSLS